MKNLGTILVAGVLLASLSSCGKSEDANQPAVADTVEMPADELPSGDPSMAAPAGDESDAMAPAADGSGAPEAAADAAQSAADSAKAAASEAKAVKAAKAPAGN
jgi:hypothetical protein